MAEASVPRGGVGDPVVIGRGLLTRLLGDAAQALQTRSAGHAVCTFTKAGVPVPGIKYAEGGWAALREVDRQASAGEAVAVTAAVAVARWREALDALEQRGAGPDWVAYRAGGADALEDLLERLTLMSE